MCHSICLKPRPHFVDLRLFVPALSRGAEQVQQEQGAHSELLCVGGLGRHVWLSEVSPECLYSCPSLHSCT